MQRCWCTQETTQVPSSWKKIKILETNAAEHKKQSKSLPPDVKVQSLNKNADAHKKNKSLFHLKIKTYLKRIILPHNTNIVSLSLLIRKLKYIQKMLLNTKNIESLSFLNRKVKSWQLMRLHTINNMGCFPLRKTHPEHSLTHWLGW